MGKVKYYECLNCKDYDTVRMESKLTDQGLEITVEKCAMCSQFHILDDNGKLIKYTHDSHSPTEPFCDNCKKGLINYPEINRRTCQCGAIGYNIPFDTLQEGDYTECNSISEYKEILMKNPYVTNLECVANCCFSMKIVVYHGGFLLWIPKHKKTKLSPEEFLRRAENTFKNQKQ